MRLLFVLSSFFVLLASASALSALNAFSGFRPSVIYGEDDRVDYYEISDPTVRRLSDSVAALFFASDLSVFKDSAWFSTGTYQKYQNLCSDQPFLSQPAAAFCSGVLVGRDLILTSGHCVKTDEDCHNIRFAFDYRLNEQREIPQSIRLENLYSCKRIIGRKHFRTGVDYALVQVDRPVQARAPLGINFPGSLRPGSEVFLLGYPMGLPLKLTGRARVRSIASGFFLTNADAFGGNSGSPVFNSSTLQIEGLLARGEADFELDHRRNCYIERRCTENGCGGESATLSAVLKRPLSWRTPQPQIEEANANAHATDARAWLRTVIRVPPSFTSRRFDLNVEVYSPAERSFQWVHHSALPTDSYGGQFRFEIAFSIGDPDLLSSGSIKGRITLLLDGKPIDSEVVPIFATQP